MKLQAPFLIGGAIAACAGLSLAGAPAPATAPSDIVTPAVVAPPPVMSARERRDRFNERVQAMLESGEGARLTDPPSVRHRARSSIQSRSPASSQARPIAVATPAVAAAPTPRPAPAADGLRTIALPDAPSRTIASALGRPTNALDCLTQAIYYEARSESEEGQTAVAEVILNRTRSGRYPSDVCDVVYQRNARTCQFSYTCDGSIGRTRVNAVAWARAERIARQVLAGETQSLLPARSVNYHANYVAPSWGRRLERVRQIGAHIFYGSALQGGTPGASDDRPASLPPSRQLTFVRLATLDRAYSLFLSSAGPTPAARPTAASAE